MALALSAVMVFAVGMGIAAGLAAAMPAQHSAAPATASHTEPGFQAGLKQLGALIDQGVGAQGIHTSAGPSPSSSYNWGGYAFVPSSSGALTQAFGEWFIPAATCPSSGDTYQAEWVGIDGYSSGTVEQGGSFDYCYSGTAYYYTWWEFYPYNDVQFIYSASAGDLISAQINYNPTICYGSSCGVYTIAVDDWSSGNNIYITTDPTTCNSNSQCEVGSDASAECISEAPGISSGIAPLADYGTSTIYACSATNGATTAGIGGFHSSVGTTYAITQIGSVTGKTDQKVSHLSTYWYKDSTFTLTWKRSD
jgi:hypothetical protein